MKLLLLISFLVSCNGIAFDNGNHNLFGIRARGGATKKDDDNKERHHNIILESINNLEKKLHDAVEHEVDTLFHSESSDAATKAEVQKKAKTAIERGSQKAKQVVEEHKVEHKLPFEDRPYPYSWPKPDEHADHKVLQAIGSAEKAVLHAVEEEVGTLFHAKDNTNKKAQVAIKEGLHKTKKSVDKAHNERKEWHLKDGTTLEEYLRFDLE